MGLIDQLRSEELRSLEAQIGQGLTDHALKVLDERGSAQELVRDQYSGRYPFELLQNANDASLGTQVRGRTHFRLTDRSLLVADNGAGFGEAQIRAICSLGRSSKGPGTAIGHKGLGFKSVGEIAESPQIISRGVGFEFNAERVQDLLRRTLGRLEQVQRFPVYAFPFEVGPEQCGDDRASVLGLLDQGYTTVIRLPLRADTSRETVASHLQESLLPRLLLFLNGVDHLELAGTAIDFVAEVGRDQEGVAEHVLLDVDGTSEEWLIYRSNMSPDPDHLLLLGDAWEGVTNLQLAIGVPLDSSGVPRPGEVFPLHVFFPTDEVTGLQVAVHAEWALNMDRRQIADTPAARPLNRSIIDALTAFNANVVVPDLVDRFPNSTKAIQVVCPRLHVPTTSAAVSLRKRWTAGLAHCEFLQVLDGSRATAADIQLLPARMPNPESAHALADLPLAHTLRSDLEKADEVRELIRSVEGSTELNASELLEVLRAPTPTTLDSYFDFLIEWRNQADARFASALAKVPCVLTMSGQVLAPGTDNVFFPRQKADVSVPDDLPLPIALIPEVEGVDLLLRELGVRPFEWRELIREYLIKILANPEAGTALRDSAMSGLRAYHAVRLSGSEDLAQTLGKVLVPARTAEGGIVRLRPAGSTYFGSDWTGSADLETIYGPFKEAEFLAVEPPTEHDQREVDRDFFEMLGVLAYPRVDTAIPNEPNGYLLGSYRHPHRGPSFDAWFSDPATQTFAACPQGHPQGQQLRISHRLDRHEEIVDSTDPLRLLPLWKQLAAHWGSTYEPATQATFRCVNTSHVGERSRTCPSIFSYLLHTTSWVPVDLGGSATLVKPHDAWMEATDTPRRILDRIPRVSEGMLAVRGAKALAEDLGLIDVARPSVDDLLALLTSIAEEKPDGPLDRETQLAARYVQRTLNDVLAPNEPPHPEPQAILLLASKGGQHLFAAQPPYAEDPLLRETWERRIPVLAAEAGLRRVADYLTLPRLDSEVMTSAMPFRIHEGDEWESNTRRRIQQIKPYLLMLVSSEVPRFEAMARNALRRLELVVCEELVLEYAYNGTTVQRADAVCYIATRRDPRGKANRISGTAYLEIDPSVGEPYWFPLGRQLAQFLQAPALADAFTMLLTATADDRLRMLVDRGLTEGDLVDARTSLSIDLAEPDLLHVLDAALPTLDPSVVGHTGAGVAQEPGVSPEVIPDATAPEVSEVETDSGALTESSVERLRIDVDIDSIPLVAARLGGVGDAGAPTRRAVTPNSRSSAPSIQSESDKRWLGKQGESYAFGIEQRRVAALGKDSARVRHVSLRDELAPYDILSVDADDQIMYIEVKSTSSHDPAEPFYISEKELLEAMENRDRYWIYRVCGVGSENPVCYTFNDLMQAILDGHARLSLSNAQVTLSVETPAEGDIP